MSTLKRLMVEIGIDLSGLADAGAKGEILGREAGERAGAGYEAGFKRKTRGLGATMGSALALEAAASSAKHAVPLNVDTAPAEAKIRRFGGLGGELLRTMLTSAVGGAVNAAANWITWGLLNRRFGRLQVDVDTSHIGEQIREAITAATTSAVGVSIDSAGLAREIHRAVEGAEYAMRPLKIHVDSTHLVREIHRAVEMAGLTSRLRLSTSNDNNTMSRLGTAAGVAGLTLGLRSLATSSTVATGSVAALSSGVGSLGIGTVVAAAAVLALIPVLLSLVTVAAYVVGGALGSLPGLLAGLTAGAGTLGLGMIGLSGAFQRAFGTGSGGGGAGAAARSASALASAQRQLERAEREVLDTRKALNQAYADAAERYEDLGRQLRASRLDEQDAVAAVADAEEQLRLARLRGNPYAIDEATRAYERAQLTLEDTRDRVGDLAAQKAKADKDGVKGSQEVLSALDRQRNAADQLLSAQEALANAQATAGGGGGAAGQVTKIARSAQQLVDVVKRLKPAFEDLRLSVQQRLFAGLGDEVAKLGGTWLPTLKRELGGYADVFNGIVRTLLGSWRKPQFIADFTAGLRSVRDLIDKVGTAIAGPLQGAFATLSRAAKPFVDALGDVLAGGIEKFSAWIDRLDKSGGLDRFFDKASRVFRDLMGIVKDFGLIIGGILSALFSNSGKRKGSLGPFEDFKRLMDGLAKWFQDPKNQKLMAGFFEMFAGHVAAVIDWLVKLYHWFEDPKNRKKIEEWVKKIEGWANKLGDMIDTADRWVKKIKFWAGLLTGTNWSGVFDGLVAAVKGAINKVIRAWNSLDLSIDVRIPDWVSLFGGPGGARFATGDLFPDVPLLARGGTALSGGLAVVGEEGRPELLQMHAGARVTPLPADLGRGGGSGRSEPVRIEFAGEREILAFVRKLVKRYGGPGSGSVQLAFGRG